MGYKEEGDFGAEDDAGYCEEVNAEALGAVVGVDALGGVEEELLKGDGCECEREHVWECSGGVENDMKLRCLQEDIPIRYSLSKSSPGCSGIRHES